MKKFQNSGKDILTFLDKRMLNEVNFVKKFKGFANSSLVFVH